MSNGPTPTSNLGRYDFIAAATDPNSPAARLNQPYLLDMETCDSLFFQTIPLEINYDPGQSWVTVAPPGRNNPLYQYTGAEDTINFIFSWYSNEEDRQDVMRALKWIEAASKNNGYNEKPHRVKLMFGKLFSDAEWIIFSSPSRLSLFDRTNDMMPRLMYHEITLKRIMTTNRTSNMIRKIDT